MKRTAFALAGLVSACSASQPLGFLPGPDACGFHAVRDRRHADGFNEAPPACALPTREEVASWCSIHDDISSPDYDSTTDENGVLVNYKPSPEYRVSGLRCDFTDGARNAATCRFRMALPGEIEGNRQVQARFTHIYWRDDGPAHHIEGVRWSLKDDCTPENPRGR